MPRLRQVGGSVMVALPRAMMHALKLNVGNEVDLSISQDGIMIKKKKYSLQELIDQCHPQEKQSEEDNAWLSNPPRGKELL